MQLFDDDRSSETFRSMSFTNYDSTEEHWTNYEVVLEGGNAGSSEYSRLSAYDNINDGGTFHEYRLEVTAKGLDGVESGGTIEATNHPTDVDGSFSGIFEITENETDADNLGFYRFDFDLNMDNWAWTNREDLTNEGGFADSAFRTGAVPEPASLMMWGFAGVACFSVIVWRRRSASVKL